MTIGSLFSGIGGLEWGLSRAGWGEVLFQVEVDENARRVLLAHWPTATQFGDIQGVSFPGYVDILCGGFPCQDLSTANVSGRRGLDGPRSGLWAEYRRLVQEIQPEWVVVENVGRTWRDWVPLVRRELRESGYASVPLRMSPAHLGYPHHRDRVFVVAHPHRDGECLRFLYEETSKVLEYSAGLGQGVRKAAYQAVALSDGLPRKLARLPGNAVVPDVAWVVGKGILETVERKNGRI
jgi:DNA (cytosine-5)-methyltransferase 1